MTAINKEVTGIGSATLPLSGLRAFTLNALLILAAAVLPAAAHSLGLPVRLLLPMHWPVLLAGLVYGWRGGLLVGAAGPLVSNLLSGMPLPLIMPAMTFELAAYGFVTGILQEKAGLSGVKSTALGILAGRVVFVISVVIMSSYSGALGDYLAAALLPGLPAAVAQMILLPQLAQKFVRQRQ